MSAGGLDFVETLLTPAAKAASARFDVANDVYIRIGILGIIARNTRAASKPFITGIERSSTIKSGFNLWACSIATRPFSASPHTSTLGCDSSTRVTARLTAIWSSTISTRFGAPMFTDATVYFFYNRDNQVKGVDPGLEA